MALSPVMCAGGRAAEQSGTVMSATEQSETIMPASGNAAAWSVSELSRIPIIEVAFKNGMWWSMPQELCRELYAQYEAGHEASYTWNWGDSRTGSWTLNGQDTPINRYTIDFTGMRQTNSDNGRMRAIRVVWARPEDITPQWTGQIRD